MISIKKHLAGSIPDVESFLEKDVEDFWGELNKKKKDGEYNEYSLVRRAAKLAEEVAAKKHINSVGAEAGKRHYEYCNYIKDEHILKGIIVAKPHEFDGIIEKANEYLKEEDFIKINDDNEEESVGFGQLLLKKLFRYSHYRSGNYCWQRYAKLNFTEASCPYCNVNAIKIIEKNEINNQLLSDVDHFYAKYRYPYLALSYYNHIPSCKDCNQSIKGSKSFSVISHIHPYDRCFDSSYRFLLNSSVLAGDAASDVKINKNGKFTDNIVSDLKLVERYKQSINSARIPKLLEILMKNTHLLRHDSNADERKRLFERLNDFGIVWNENKIILNVYSKFQRDVIKMIDVEKSIIL